MSLVNLLFIGVAVLLPIVPAYLLYRLLPSESKVEGPWQGLKIKLGGAFGGYFLVLITIFVFSERLPQYEVWSVTGNIGFEDGRGDGRTVTFGLVPPSGEAAPDGRFQLTLFAEPDHAGNNRLPTLVLDHDGYDLVSIDLENRDRVTKHTFSKRLEIVDTIVLVPSLGDSGRGHR